MPGKQAGRGAVARIDHNLAPCTLWPNGGARRSRYQKGPAEERGVGKRQILARPDRQLDDRAARAAATATATAAVATKGKADKNADHSPRRRTKIRLRLLLRGFFCPLFKWSLPATDDRRPIVYHDRRAVPLIQAAGQVQLDGWKTKIKSIGFCCCCSSEDR